MTPLFKKLNLGERRPVVVLNAPASFEAELAALHDVAVLRDPEKCPGLSFGLAFATRQAELDRYARWLLAAAAEDAVLWFAYPKGSSKRYRCEFNRDAGWQVLEAAGYDSVRMVAIDADWCALRFRHGDFIRPAGGRSRSAP
jgi:hypothetical protein